MTEGLKFRDAVLLVFEMEVRHCGFQGLVSFEIRCSTGAGEDLEVCEIRRSRTAFGREGFHEKAHGLARHGLPVEFWRGSDAIGSGRVTFKFHALAFERITRRGIDFADVPAVRVRASVGEDSRGFDQGGSGW